MTAVIDACVIIDALQNREPFSADAQKLFLAVSNRRFEGALTAKSITDIFFAGVCTMTLLPETAYISCSCSLILPIHLQSTARSRSARK